MEFEHACYHAAVQFVSHYELALKNPQSSCFRNTRIWDLGGCVSLHVNALGKGMNSAILPLTAIGK